MHQSDETTSFQHPVFIQRFYINDWEVTLLTRVGSVHYKDADPSYFICVKQRNKNVHSEQIKNVFFPVS